MNPAYLDTYTMISLMGFGHLLMLVLLLAYRGGRPRGRAFNFFLAARVLQGVGWVLISYRGVWPDFLTADAGNISLILGVAAENIAFISYRERWVRLERFFLSVAGLGALVFVVFARTPHLIVGIGAAVALVLHLPTAIVLLRRRHESAILRVMGVLFAIVSAAFVVRMIAGFRGTLEFAVSPALVQSSFFLPVFAILLAGSIAMALLLKEEDERALRDSREKYNALFHSTPSAVFLSEPESGVVLEANAQCRELTGYAPEEVRGRTFTELGLWQPGEREKAVAAAQTAGRLVGYEIGGRNRIGQNRTWLVSAGVVRLQHRTLLASSILDITGRKSLEVRIQRLLEEKELLLGEVHHRVRNNLSQIIGILQLQADRPDLSAAAVIEDTANRVRGMLALYDQIYAGKHYAAVPGREFLSVLTERLCSAFPKADSVRLTLEVEDLEMPARIVSSFGQLVNELVTNSLKHAFRDMPEGNIQITLRQDGSGYVFEYQDDGRGLPQVSDDAGEKGFGTILIESLAHQLGAEWRMSGSPGVWYRFRF